LTVIEADFDDILKKEILVPAERKSAFHQHVKALHRNGLIERFTDPQIHGERLAIAKQWWDLVLGELKRNGRIE
jgi:hypothetical protein